MPPRLRLAAPLLLALAVAAMPAAAKEYNKLPFLDAGKQSKVEVAIAGAMMVRGQQEATASRFKTVTNTDCGKLEVGNVKNPKAAPRDNIVVTGDIINVAQNCGVQH